MSMVNIYKDDMVAIADDTQVADMVAAGWSTEPPVKEEVIESSTSTTEPVASKKRKIGGE